MSEDYIRTENYLRRLRERLKAELEAFDREKVQHFPPDVIANQLKIHEAKRRLHEEVKALSLYDERDDDDSDDPYAAYSDDEVAIELRIERFGYGPYLPPIPWTEKPPLRNDERMYDKGQGKAAFEAEQRHKMTQFVGTPNPEPSRVLQTPGHAVYFTPAPSRKSVGLYLCRVCRTEFALWPTELAKKFSLFGVGLTVTLRTPIACTNCRIMRFKEVSRLGRLDHRPAWKNIFALVTDSEPPVLSLKMRVLVGWRRRLSPSVMLRQFREWMW